MIYSREIVDPGKWRKKTSRNSAEFTNHVNDAESG
jgi:hypothetical protein